MFPFARLQEVEEELEVLSADIHRDHQLLKAIVTHGVLQELLAADGPHLAPLQLLHQLLEEVALVVWDL